MEDHGRHVVRPEPAGAPSPTADKTPLSLLSTWTSFKNQPVGHRVVYVYAIVFLVWLLLTTKMLMTTSLVYMFRTRDQARQQYLVATADRLAIRASDILAYGLAARDAIDYAVQHQRYYDPMDYEALRAAAEPIFVQAPHLHAVDVAFTDRPDSISMLRLYDITPVGATPDAGVLMQSDASDCRSKLGPLGCSAAEVAPQKPWYEAGLALQDGSFRWVPHPGFIHTAGTANDTCNLGGRCLGGEVDNADTVAWSPAYTLVFRSLFPGTYGTLAVIARAVLDVGALRLGGDFDDGGRLGDYGAALLCDVEGSVIAAAALGAQVRVLSSAMLQFRKAWELVHADWADDLSTAWSQLSAGGVREHKTRRFRFVGEQLSARGLGNFYVIVVADSSPFNDDTLMDLGTFAMVWSWCPYPFLAMIWGGYACAMRRRQQ